MKHFLTFIILLFSLSAFAEDVVIRDHLSVSAEVAPDVMTSTVRVSGRAVNFEDSSAIMEHSADIIKDSDICSYNSYSVSPVYKYTGNTRASDGYLGSTTAVCSFTDIRHFSAFTEKLNKLDPEVYEINMSSVNWVVSDVVYASAVTDLKRQLLISVGSNSDSFAGFQGKNCTVTAVDFTSSSPAARPLMMLKAAEISAPDRLNTTVTVSADVSYICK